MVNPKTPLSRNSILEKFHSYGCPVEKYRIGGEYERSIVHLDGQSVGYDDEFGIRWFLQSFADRWGWTPKLEKDNVIALYKDDASIT